MNQIRPWLYIGKYREILTFAIAILKKVEGLTPLEAFKVVKQAHPVSLPHLKLWESLCAYYGESVSWVEIAKIK